MHILFLTQIVPFPPDAGPKVKTWYLLRHLIDRGHAVTLVSFVRPEEELYISRLRSLCSDVYPVPIRRSRFADAKYMFQSYFSGRPFLVERDDLVEMRITVNQLLMDEAIDVIHADQLSMVQFAFPQDKRIPSDLGSVTIPNNPRVIFDAHNAVWTVVERMRQTAPWFIKPVLAMEASRVKRYEGLLVQQVDHTLAVTEIDRKALLQAHVTAVGTSINGMPPISVIPIAVGTEQLKPVIQETGSRNILTLGTLHYPPNADGIRWFIRDVFPLVRKQVPEATLTVVGKNPPTDFFRFASQHSHSIKITGYVPDLTPYLEQAALMVVPVRAGGGMRVRILEAFSRAMPVVTTTVGLEGIEAQPDKDVFVEDSPTGFADAVVRLLNDDELRVNLGTNGRQLVETRYDWKIVYQMLDDVYENPVIKLGDEHN